jgi:ABC-type transporter lipoprotein component MlaA
MMGFGFFLIYLWLPILRAESFRDAHSLLIALAQDNLQIVYTEASARLLTTALRQIQAVV